MWSPFYGLLHLKRKEGYSAPRLLQSFQGVLPSASTPCYIPSPSATFFCGAGMPSSTLKSFIGVSCLDDRGMTFRTHTKRLPSYSQRRRQDPRGACDDVGTLNQREIPSVYSGRRHGVTGAQQPATVSVQQHPLPSSCRCTYFVHSHMEEHASHQNLAIEVVFRNSSNLTDRTDER